MFVNNKDFSGNLNEDLNKMGITLDVDEMKRLSSTRLDEAHYGNSPENTEEEIDDDSELEDIEESDVREFLDKLVNTDFDSDEMTEEQYEEIVELCNAVGEIEDEELAEYFDQVMGLIEARRVTRVRTGKGGFRRQKKTSAKKKLKSRKYRKTHKAKIKRMAKKHARTSEGKKTARLANYRKKKFGEDSEEENDYMDEGIEGLKDSLDDILHERHSEDSHQDVTNRLGRIFKLISERIENESVVDMLEDSYIRATDLLEEELTEEEFVESLKPTLKVLNTCLKYVYGDSKN